MKSRPSRRRAARHADLRLEILRAAGRVFRVRGFADAGVREIAEAADLSAANLYHYFRGKDEILFFCQDRALDQFLDTLAAAQKTRGPLADRLHALAVAHVLCLVDEVDGAVAHLEVDALPPALRAQIVAKRDRYEVGVRKLIVTGIRQGVFRRTNPVVATRAFLGALTWTVQWFRPEGKLSAADVARLTADYAVAGLVGGE